MIKKLDDRNPHNLKVIVDTINQLIDQREKDKASRDKQIAVFRHEIAVLKTKIGGK